MVKILQMPAGTGVEMNAVGPGTMDARGAARAKASEYQVQYLANTAPMESVTSQGKYR